MRARPSSTGEIVWSLLRWTLLVPILFAFGCANKPNLIPEGYGAVFQNPKYPARAMAAAEVDYSIPVSVEQDAKNVPIFWTKKGEVIWTEPFWNSVTWWRFGLIADGVTDALCSTDWTRVGTKDLTEIPCAIDVKNFPSISLVGMLDYCLGGDKEKSPGDNGRCDGTVARVYWIQKK